MRCSALTSVDLGDSVTSIGVEAFMECSALTSVTIGNSVTSIGDNAFYDCSSVTDVYCYADPSVLSWDENGCNDFKANRQTRCHVFNAEDWSGFVPIVNVTFVGDLAIDLADNADNDSLLITWNNRKVNARLQDRILYKNGQWNTLCLPFSLSSVGGDLQSPTFADTPLEGATVVELDVNGTYNGKQTGYDTNTGILRLYFKSATSITAGKSYLVKWAAGATGDIASPVFRDGTVSSDAPTGVTSSDGRVTFTGSYAPVSITGEDKTLLFLDADNSLHHPNTATTINAFRARFLLPDGIIISNIGDVNGDKSKSVTDVTMLVNNILGKSDDNFIMANADINGDGQVTVTDVTALVNIILSGNGNTFTIVTNLDDLPLTFGGGSSGPARVARK